METTTSRSEFRFFARGEAKAQPRAKARAFGKIAQVYNPKTADNWKGCVRAAAESAGLAGRRFSTPVRVHLFFAIARPKSHHKSGDFEKPLKPGAPVWMGSKPDADNLAKAVMDALSDCGAWHDDALVASLHVTKQYSSMRTGCEIMIEEIKGPRNEEGGK